MARALLIGCGCRARTLGARLLAEGWRVRGTTRAEARTGTIEQAGIEAAIADPDRVGTVLDQIADVAVVGWLLGSATGDPELLAALHGPRLERLFEELVDTPVRGFVYEAAGSVAPESLGEGRRVVADASARWRIPAELLDHDPADARGWSLAAEAAFARLVGL